jgi:hypothetical protein
VLVLVLVLVHLRVRVRVCVHFLVLLRVLVLLLMRHFLAHSIPPLSYVCVLSPLVASPPCFPLPLPQRRSREATPSCCFRGSVRCFRGSRWFAPIIPCCVPSRSRGAKYFGSGEMSGVAAQRPTGNRYAAGYKKEDFDKPIITVAASVNFCLGFPAPFIRSVRVARLGACGCSWVLVGVGCWN